MGPMAGMADIAMPGAYVPWAAADFGGGRRHRRRHLSAHAFEIRLPDALPLALRLRPQSLAGGPRGRIADGCGARALLSRLLLVLDGAVVCRRDHEPPMDGGNHC